MSASENVSTPTLPVHGMTPPRNDLVL